MSIPVVRRMTPADIPDAVALQRACFPAPFPEELLWQAEHLQRHLELFPAGQFVAVADNEIVGSASSCLISEENWLAHRSWDETVGGPFLHRHDPKGSTMYGLDISVHPLWRGRGVGRALYAKRFELVRARGLARYGTACRMPGFRPALESRLVASPGEYGAAVAAGRLPDRTLSPLLRYGLRFIDVIEAYMDDVESGNAAAILEWAPDKDTAAPSTS